MNITDFEQKILCLDSPYPLDFVLRNLIYAAEYLLHEKSYDGHNYEEIEQSVKKAKGIYFSVVGIEWENINHPQGALQERYRLKRPNSWEEVKKRHT